MARTVLNPVTLTANAVTSDPAGTSVDPTNDHSFLPDIPTTQYLIRVTNTTGSSKTVTLVAGVGSESGVGDLSVALGAGDVTPVTKWFGPFTSARFQQSDGTVHVNIPASMTGTITVFKIPRRF